MLFFPSLIYPLLVDGRTKEKHARHTATAQRRNGEGMYCRFVKVDRQIVAMGREDAMHSGRRAEYSGIAVGGWAGGCHPQTAREDLDAVWESRGG